MFFCNNTEAFMKANFTTAEDYKFLAKTAREMKGADSQRRLDIIAHSEQKIAQKQAKAQKRKDKQAEIASLPLILDGGRAKNLKGIELINQFRAFKVAGAPNLQNMPNNSKANDKRAALERAVELYLAKEWNPYKNEEEHESDWTEVDDESDSDNEEL
ncbi:hypothetical protein AX14_008584 [Amanita brunnescens Koide BX004]|nr:hypothetical protein AX14_008584 [Amanita brunnescens Koide BX004]